MVAALLVVAAALASWWNSRLTAHGLQTVDRTHRVLYELEATLAHAVSIQSGARGFALTGDDRSLAPYHAGISGIQQSIARLQMLMADERDQIRVRRLSALVDEEISVARHRLHVRRTEGLLAVSAAVADGRDMQATDAIRGFVSALQADQRRAIDVDSTAMQRAGVLALASAIGACLVSAALIAFTARRLAA